MREGGQTCSGRAPPAAPRTPVSQMPKDLNGKLAPEERKLLWSLTSSLPFEKGGFSETVPFWSWAADTLYTPARTVRCAPSDVLER